MMHVLANIGIKPSENVMTEVVIPWFTNFTLLFMMISAFSMCCGYYERIKSGAITPARFYSKRYHRTLPFFGMMVMISFAMEPGWDTFCQTFANLTMCFNLLPNPKIEIIGVGWFLGTVFTFYMLFPFFTFLLYNKKRGWMVLAISLVFTFVAVDYFNNGNGFMRGNIINSAPFFIVGGMIYLYRARLKNMVEKHRCMSLLLVMAMLVLKFNVSLKEISFELMDLLLFAVLLIYAIGSKHFVLNNRVAKYLSDVSMEVYLCHMMFFRVASMLHMERFIGNGDFLYVMTVIVTLLGAICFSHVVKYMVFPMLKIK